MQGTVVDELGAFARQMADSGRQGGHKPGLMSLYLCYMMSSIC